MDEIDLGNVNQIDMECSVADDDDDFIVRSSKPSGDGLDGDVLNEGREIKSHTGIIINLSDDESQALARRHFQRGAPEIPQGETMNLDEPTNFNGINEIDMECSIGEDDDFGFPNGRNTEQSFVEGTLTDDEIMNEERGKPSNPLNQGVVEDDYYERIKKRHAATNVRGAYNTHFHLSGCPERDMYEFNRGTHAVGPVPSMPTTLGNIDGGEAEGVSASAEGMAMGEELNEEYKGLFNDILLITGFELKPLDKGGCCLRDTLMDGEDIPCSSIEDVKSTLYPYVQDCFVVPLQVETGNDLKDPQDWIRWYTPDMAKRYPQCKHDIDCCNVWANHLGDCGLFR